MTIFLRMFIFPRNEGGGSLSDCTPEAIDEGWTSGREDCKYVHFLRMFVFQEARGGNLIDCTPDAKGERWASGETTANMTTFYECSFFQEARGGGFN